MENVRESHNSISLSSYASTVFIPPGKTLPSPKGRCKLQAVCLDSFPLGSPSCSTWQGHFSVFHVGAIKLVPITTKAKSRICTPVHVLVRSEGEGIVPVQSQGRTQCPSFRWDSLYTWRKGGSKATVRSLLLVPRASP